MPRGYTLLEVLVVLAIIGLVLASVPMLAGTGRPGPESRAAALELASALRQTRGEAIANYRSVVFVLDLENRIYRVGADGPQRPLPDDMQLSLYTARTELVDEGAGGIRFFPDGSATGGRVTLAGGGRSYTVSVDWLTGFVAVER